MKKVFVRKVKLWFVLQNPPHPSLPSLLLPPAVRFTTDVISGESPFPHDAVPSTVTSLLLVETGLVAVETCYRQGCVALQGLLSKLIMLIFAGSIAKPAWREGWIDRTGEHKKYAPGQACHSEWRGRQAKGYYCYLAQEHGHRA